MDKNTKSENINKLTLYQKLFDLSPAGIMLEDAKGNILEVNDALTKIFGYSREEFLTMNVRKLVSPDTLNVVDEHIIKILIDNKFDHEVINYRKDGTLCHIELREIKFKLPNGDDGILAICNDITERKNIENELHESDERLRNIINSTPDIICLKDGQGRWLEANSANIELFNLESINYKGKTDSELAVINPYFKDSFFKCIESDEKAWRQEIMSRSEEYITQKNGSVRIYDIIKVPIFDKNNNRKELIVVGRDVTDIRNSVKEIIKAKEKAEKATETKSNFLATISHEIRTPMNGVIGMTKILLESDLNKDQRETVEIIEKSSSTLLNLINQVLEFSKIESEHISLDLKPFNLRNLINDSLELFKPETVIKNITSNLYVSEDTPEYFEGDIGKLKQIFNNLYSNALKFTESGSIDISVNVENKVKNNYTLLVAIKDTGYGVSAADMHKLFTPFYRIGLNSGKSTKGSGLGLSICKKLIEMMNGKIWAESTVGKGSTFFFTIELKSTVKPSYHDTPKKQFEYRNLSEKHPLNILLAEDNPVNQKVAMSILKKFGYIPDVAVNGFMVLECLEKKHYDIIFMDIQMPEMNGFETTIHILEKYKKNPPHIIAITAAAMKGDMEKCMAVGMNDYISKPIFPESVYVSLMKYLLK